MFFDNKIKASQIIWEQKEKISKDLRNHRNKLLLKERIEDYPEFLAKELLLVTQEQQLWQIYFRLKEKNL